MFLSKKKIKLYIFNTKLKLSHNILLVMFHSLSFAIYLHQDDLKAWSW